ncbi:MAG: hypothetical protein A6F72_08895 [Cycloclasticus sp. symbiont of Poecilosclerida sp. N]|nr:MAG: hypothetical protein A6F72_08895 [Cycloclasticus sp. symbiont of Poecilosclerida sp. N]
MAWISTLFLIKNWRYIVCKLKNNLLVILMLIGFIFSTNVLAWVDCNGLESGYHYDVHEDDRGNCIRFQALSKHANRDWISEDTGIIRKANVRWDGVVRYAKGRRSFFDNFFQRTPVKKVEKTSMTMDEIRAYKFNPSLNSYMTPLDNIIAKTLIEKYDLWNVYRVAETTGVRYVLKKNGLEYAGGEMTDYSKNIHAGNIFVYMDNNFSLVQVKKNLKLNFQILL